jgi:hypothetical protein
MELNLVFEEIKRLRKWWLWYKIPPS